MATYCACEDDNEDVYKSCAGIQALSVGGRALVAVVGKSLVAMRNGAIWVIVG
jgi:hypothetical protein